MLLLDDRSHRCKTQLERKVGLRPQNLQSPPPPRVTFFPSLPSLRSSEAPPDPLSPASLSFAPMPLATFLTILPRSLVPRYKLLSSSTQLTSRRTRPSLLSLLLTSVCQIWNSSTASPSAPTAWIRATAAASGDGEARVLKTSEGGWAGSCVRRLVTRGCLGFGWDIIGGLRIDALDPV